MYIGTQRLMKHINLKEECIQRDNFSKGPTFRLNLFKKEFSVNGANWVSDQRQSTINIVDHKCCRECSCSRELCPVRKFDKETTDQTDHYHSCGHLHVPFQRDRRYWSGSRKSFQAEYLGDSVNHVVFWFPRNLAGNCRDPSCAGPCHWRWSVASGEVIRTPWCLLKCEINWEFFSGIVLWWEYDGVRALELDNGKNEKSEEVALKLKNCRCERAALRTDRVERLEIVRAADPPICSHLITPECVSVGIRSEPITGQTWPTRMLEVTQNHMGEFHLSQAWYQKC